MGHGHAYGHDMHKPDGVFSSLVSGPDAPLLSIAEAKLHCRVDFADDDDLLSVYIAAATDMLDAEWGELGRALVTQRWQLTLTAFPSGRLIVLPVPPVQQVTSITYYDTDNAEQTLSTDTYTLVVNGEDGRIYLNADQSWPATYDRADAVAVQYDAGYGDAAADVPEGIRLAARLMVAHWYENRAAVTERAMSQLPMGIRTLLHKYRVVRGHF